MVAPGVVGVARVVGVVGVARVARVARVVVPVVRPRMVRPRKVRPRIGRMADGGNREKTKGDGGYITEELTWVQCDRCSKWRVVSGDDLPESWYCEMNADKAFASCNVAEQE